MTAMTTSLSFHFCPIFNVTTDLRQQPSLFVCYTLLTQAGGWMRMHITLQDVAKLAGVSAKTVSRVVNNQGEISPLTRRHVQAAIDQLGYRPNFLARSLVRQRTSTLAVVASGLEFYGPSHTITGIEQQSYQLGYSLLFSLLPQPRDIDVVAILDSFATRRVDGIIWAVPEIGNNRAWIQPDLLDSLPPIVFISMGPHDGLSIVSIDNRTGAAQAAEHLIQLGRRQIGLISGPMDWWETRERFDGFTGALRQAGISIPPEQIAEGDWSASSGKRCMEQILQRCQRLDAIFACNDQMALGALGVAHEQGRRVPEDIAFIGFDDIPEAGCFWPPLTTVRQELFNLGAVSVQILQKQIEARQQMGPELAAETQILGTEFLVRESSIGCAHG